MAKRRVCWAGCEFNWASSCLPLSPSSLFTVQLRRKLDGNVRSNPPTDPAFCILLLLLQPKWAACYSKDQRTPTYTFVNVIMLIRKDEKATENRKNALWFLSPSTFFPAFPIFTFYQSKVAWRMLKREKERPPPHFWALYFILIDAHFAVRGSDGEKNWHCCGHMITRRCRRYEKWNLINSFGVASPKVVFFAWLPFPVSVVSKLKLCPPSRQLW